MRAKLLKTKDTIAEIWQIAYRPLSCVVGCYAALITVAEFVQNALPSICFSIDTFLVGFASFLVICLIVLIRSAQIAKRTCISVEFSIRKSTQITAIAGDYIDTLELLKHDMISKGRSLDGLICVAGFTSSGDLKYITDGSVIMAIVKKIAAHDVAKDSISDLDNCSLEQLLQYPSIQNFNESIKQLYVIVALIHHYLMEHVYSSIFLLLMIIGAVMHV